MSSGLKAVDEIAADKQSGATALSLKAIDVYAILKRLPFPTKRIFYIM